MQPLPSPALFRGLASPLLLPPRVKSREATHLGVAHDQGAEEQACQQDSHGGEAGALDSGSTREGEVRGRSAGAREGGPGGLLQFRAGAPKSPAGRARGDQAPPARPSILSGGSEVVAQPALVPAGEHMGTERGDSACSRSRAGAASKEK